MREKLVRSDFLECVIGLGPNLFYNSPMEACIVVCRTKKPESHKGYVLFINAVNEVVRKNGESNLEPQHIKRIADAYEKFENDGVFAAKASIRDIEKNGFILSIPLYVRDSTSIVTVDPRSQVECFEEWQSSSTEMNSNFDVLNQMLGGEYHG